MPAKGQELRLGLAAAETDKKAPDELRRWLAPREQLIWWCYGRGSTLDSWSVFGCVVMIGWGAFFGFVGLISRDNQWLPISGFFFASAGVQLVVQTAIGAHLQTYGLTDRRLIFMPSLGFIPPRFLGEAGEAGDRKIYLLRVTGRRDRGSVRVQGAYREGPFRILDIFGSRGPLRLTGVRRPAEVAALIKSTLKLDIPIEDRTS